MKAETKATNRDNGWYIAKHNGIMADQVHNFQNGTDEYGTTFEQWEGAGYTLTPVTVTPVAAIEAGAVAGWEPVEDGEIGIVVVALNGREIGILENPDDSDPITRYRWSDWLPDDIRLCRRTTAPQPDSEATP